METPTRYPELPVLDHGGESHRCASNPEECLGCWLVLNHGIYCEDNNYRCCELDSCPDGCAHEVVMQQCINCGHVEVSRYSCSRCGSADLHVFEAMEVK